MFPKRALQNGYIVDYPSEQRFEVRLTKGKNYASFIFPGGVETDDTTDVTMPVKLFLEDGGQIAWEMYALNVDTLNDHLLRSMDDREMIRRLSAPSNSLKAYMVEISGYYRLRLNDYQGARNFFREASVIDSTKRNSYYYDIVCAYARENKAIEAFEWLRRAVDNGFRNYAHALKDSDLASIRPLPEFRRILASTMSEKRAKLMEKIKTGPNTAGNTLFEIARTYIEYGDIDSFFLILENSLKTGYFPDLDFFTTEQFNPVKNNPRLDSLLELYSERNSNRVFSEFEAKRKPGIVRRVQIEQHISTVPFNKYPNLVEVRIFRHDLFTALPPELATLKKLRILRFVGGGLESFGGTVTKCIGLDTLTADKGGSKTLPSNFGNLVNLRQLKLCSGKLEKLPGSFRMLLKLNDLSLSGNAFLSFPAHILSLKSLEHLDLSGNSISKIPDSLMVLTSLQSLNLADNRIKFLPRSLGMLKKLSRLDLSLNRLSMIPFEIAALRQLEYLDVSFNELKRLPLTLRKMQWLKTLILFGNQLEKSEIDTLRLLLPNCRIIGDEQNMFQPRNIVQDKIFRDASVGLSFGYPSHFTLTRGKAKDDSSIIFIELARREVSEWEEDSVTYKFSSNAALTITFSKENFDRSAEEAGFEKTERADGVTEEETEEDDKMMYPLWVSRGRQGMSGDAFAVSYNGWKGFFGTNFTGSFGYSDGGGSSGYRGLKEFYAAFARKKLRDGISITLSFFDELGEEDLFFNILSSIHLKNADVQ